MAKILIEIEESDWDAILAHAGGDDGLEESTGISLDSFRQVEKPELFLFIRDNKYVENTITDEYGNELEQWMIYWDKAEFGECPVCSEELPEDSDVCSYCGFDTVEHNDNHQEAIRCAKVAMEKQAKETRK